MPGIYISWPFCAQKCTFCNFASGVRPKELEQQYLQAMLDEIREHAWAWNPETIYLGGGTPGSAGREAIGALLEACPRRGKGDGKWREATMEAAPGWIATGVIEAWVSAGINRVSLGVQSFVRKELSRTGRKHDAETVVRDVGLLRAAGINNINIDLIAGLPGQTEASWMESLESVIGLGVPHASVYMLEVDDDSRLGAEILLGGERYGAPDVPSEDGVAEFYERAVEYLQMNGIERYEISNFARPGFESLHNLKYWTREPYVGFGADAHSFDGADRSKNAETPEDYVARAQRGETVRVETTRARPEEEKFFVGLRLREGVAADEADWARYGSAFRRFLAEGMMEYTGDHLRLTDRGVMVSNEIFEEFLTA